MTGLPATYSIEDFGHELENSRLRAVLAPAVYQPTAERLAQICERYRTEPGWRMLGCRSGEEIAGCLGLSFGASGQATIRHISVASDQRGRGIGSAMIRYAVATFALIHLSAETDRDAVEFYRKCFFAIQSLGELYPGTERFLCTYIATTREDEIDMAEQKDIADLFNGATAEADADPTSVSNEQAAADAVAAGLLRPTDLEGPDPVSDEEYEAAQRGGAGQRGASPSSILQQGG